MLDIVITSSSRPEMLQQTWESFKKMVIYRGEKRVIVHEDCVYPEKSNEVISYLVKLESKGEIDEVIISTKPIGLGNVLNRLVNNYITSKYCFYIQDDWMFERPIDLDRLIHVMDNHDNINLIFLKRSKNTLIKEVKFNDVSMCVFQLWSFNPGLWRIDTFRKYWKPIFETEPELKFNNNMGTKEERRNMGLYVLGRHNSYNHIKHLGYNMRMASWHRDKEGKPGIHLTKEKLDLENKAPWL